MSDHDPRFSRLRTDPRFRKPKKNKQKVVVDERFKSIFDDDKKGAKKKLKGGRVDKYGRHISATHEKDNIRRFYRLEGEETEKEEKPPAVVDYARGEGLLESSDEEDENGQGDQESADEDEVILGRHASKPIPVLAEEELLEVDLNESEDEDAYAALDAQAAAYSKEHAEDNEAEQSGTKTNRLAVVNLDWDHVRANHLYKIFSSLVSATAPSASVAVSAAKSAKGKEKSTDGAKIVRGKVRSVRIYPSEFGKARLKKEEVEGPPKEIFKKSRRYDEEDDTLEGLIQEDEGDEFDEKALRKYQLERLRYYYAIVTCDTVDAAAHLLNELDGTELERSANVFDISFVPDDMTFDDEFRDEATPATETAGASYKGLDFSTDALRHSKVSLKWDEDDPERNKITRRALTLKEIEEGDYRAYIASSGSEDDSEEEAESKKGGKGKSERERLRKLLLGGGGPDDLPEGWGADPFGDGDDGAEGDMEITFMPGLSEAAKTGDETTLEKYKRKQKEKRESRKKEQKEKGGEKKETKETKAKKAKGIDDDFFAAESASEDEEEDTKDKKKKSKSKSNLKDRSESPAEEVRPATEAELELLVAPDDASGVRKHFDMKSILKAEKTKGKKKSKKGKKKGVDDRDEDIQEDFSIDVKDDRFKALHEDHTFAIDPSNPHFKKTKSMASLLDERAKRQSGKERKPEETNLARNDIEAPTQSLQSLVESVKRKSSHAEAKGVGKRRKL